jgi:hypothetical protein
MSKKSSLLSAISVAALAVGTSQSAIASLGSEHPDDTQYSRKAVCAGRESDLFIELILATGNQLTPESARAALPEILDSITRENAAAIPDLITNIRSLGVSRKVRDAVLETVAELIAVAPDLAAHPDLQMRLAVEIGRRASGKLWSYRLAMAKDDENRAREITDPNYSWELDCVSVLPPMVPTSVDGY